MIQAGIEPPVKKPMQSFVNELQLNSAARSAIFMQVESDTDLVDGTVAIRYQQPSEQ